MTFVDTNVFVHATAPTSPEHERAQIALVALTQTEMVAISRQVMREYVGVMTRPQPWASPVRMEQVLRDITAYANLFVVAEDGPEVWTRFAGLCQAHRLGGKQVHDAYLAATMLAHGGKRLLTFNAKHFRRFSPLIEVVEP